MERSPAIDQLLDDLRSGIQAVFQDRLVGLYLFGSLVFGGFDPDVSDIDLLAAVNGELRDDDLDALREFHDRFVLERSAWHDRIEGAYLPVPALQTFRERASRIAIISPGEPLHFTMAGRDWLTNWYQVQEGKVALVGLPPAQVVAPISKDEYIREVRGYGRELMDRFDPTAGRKAFSYTVLSLCRVLYAHRV